MPRYNQRESLSDSITSNKWLRCTVLPGGKAPCKISEESPGYELFSAEHAIIRKRSSRLIKLQIELHLPENTYGRIVPINNLTNIHGIDVTGCIITQNCKDAIKIMLRNTSRSVFYILPGDVIAQLIIERYETPDVYVVEHFLSS